MFTPLLADLDPVQIIIVVIAMAGGFIQWLWNLIQQSRSEAERRRAGPPTDEENVLREEAWKRQTQGTPTPPRPSPTATPPPVNDPFSTVRELFEQVKREAMEGQKPQPAAPPPMRQHRPASAPRRGPVAAEVAAPPYKPAARRGSFREGASPHLAASAAVVTPQASRPSAPEPTPAQAVPQTTISPAWTSLLNSPAGLKQAFILREILGPPKALQTSGDSAA